MTAFLFGKKQDLNVIDESTARDIIARARDRAAALAQTDVDRIIEVIDRVGRLWLRGGSYYSRALEGLKNELSFSAPMIEATLDLIPAICERKSLLKRLNAEFNDYRMLNGFVRRSGDAPVRIKAVPHGVLLHVSAGNVFLGCVDSLVSALLTKNVALMKLSSRNRFFPGLFAESLRDADAEGVISDKFAMLHWAGGNPRIEDIFKQSVDAVLVWGGADTVRSYRTGLPEGVALIEHGPKISFQVLCSDSLQTRDIDRVAKNIAHEISIWDQAACASPQNLFIQQGIDPKPLMEAVGKALDAQPCPRGSLDADEQVELLKERYRGELTSLTEGGEFLEGASWMLHFDPNPGMRASALNRCLILKSFRSVGDLISQIKPHSRLLQSCSYLADGVEKELLLDRLATVGVQRFAPLGAIMEGAPGAPHDGRFGLVELIRFVGDESKAADSLQPVTCTDILNGDVSDGYVFSSGGTTGDPKFAFFTHDEFDRVGAMLAKGLRAQGIERGDRCANLFVAGNLWSSFMAVERALKHLGAVHLPIGGLAEKGLVLGYLKLFKPRAVLGLPSLLVELARESAERRMQISIPLVCYAGEHLNRQARELLARTWGTQHCFSAGYASVDGGPIGYQCRFCADREHHVFSEEVLLEIVEDEAIITSTVRQAMPVVGLHTGDFVEWSSAPGELCPCGSRDRKFLLHGRCDGQINLWSCRIQLGEIEAGLYEGGLRSPVYQVRVFDDSLDVLVESEDLSDTQDRILRAVYAQCKDLKATHPLKYVEEKIRFRGLPVGSLERIARTGKVRPVVDCRKL